MESGGHVVCTDANVRHAGTSCCGTHDTGTQTLNGLAQNHSIFFTGDILLSNFIVANMLEFLCGVLSVLLVVMLSVAYTHVRAAQQQAYIHGAIAGAGVAVAGMGIGMGAWFKQGGGGDNGKKTTEFVRDMAHELLSSSCSSGSDLEWGHIGKQFVKQFVQSHGPRPTPQRQRQQQQGRVQSVTDMFERMLSGAGAGAGAPTTKAE